jgi:hypothetical protein
MVEGGEFEPCDKCGLRTCDNCLAKLCICDSCFAVDQALHPETARLFYNATVRMNDLVSAGAREAEII